MSSRFGFLSKNQSKFSTSQMKRASTVLLSTMEMHQHLANELAKRLGKDACLINLTTHGASWFIHLKAYRPTPDAKAFQKEWKTHPEDFHTIKIAGKEVTRSRFSQSWGYSYSCSETVAPARDFCRIQTGKRSDLW